MVEIVYFCEISSTVIFLVLEPNISPIAPANNVLESLDISDILLLFNI